MSERFANWANTPVPGSETYTIDARFLNRSEQSALEALAQANNGIISKESIRNLVG